MSLANSSRCDWTLCVFIKISLFPARMIGLHDQSITALESAYAIAGAPPIGRLK